jgi:hypothetical protein
VAAGGDADATLAIEVFVYRVAAEGDGEIAAVKQAWLTWSLY